MTIYQISTEDKKNMLDFAVEKKFANHDEMVSNFKKILGDNLDVNIINQRIEFINSFTYCVIDRDAFANEDRNVLQQIKSLISFTKGKAIPIIIWKGISEEYKKELVESGMQNLICEITYDEQKEEILECFSEKGMQRYNTNWKTSGTENYEKYIFKMNKMYSIQILTTSNAIKCKSISLSFCMYLNNVGARVGYAAPLSSNKEIIGIANLLGATEQYKEDKKDGENIYYVKDNITITNDPEIILSSDEKYDFFIHDLGYFDELNYKECKNGIIDEKIDKNLIICDLNMLEIDLVKQITTDLGQKIVLVNSSNKYIDIDELQGIDKEYFGLLDKNLKIKRIEKQEDIIDIRTNRNIFSSLIEPHIATRSNE